jgi:hypothetical protein
MESAVSDKACVAMNERREGAMTLAKEVAKGSIIAKATERLIYQIVEVCAEHEREAVEAMRAKCYGIVEEQFSLNWKRGESMDAFNDVLDAIRALKGNGEG